jgi:glycosyltransferase involved in cell wall biosynthesis
MNDGSRKRVVVIASLADSLINFRGPLLRTLVASGHEVLALAPASEGIEKQLAALGVRFEAIPLERTGLNPVGDAALFARLVRALRRLRPDCVLAYTIKPVVYGSIAARLAGVPVIAAIITGLGFAFTDGSGVLRIATRRIAQWLYRHALRAATVVFFQNPDDRDLFVQLGLLGGARVVMIDGSGVDLEHYAPVPLPSKPAFLMIARLVRDKGVLEYVDAARRLRREYPDVLCALAGWFDTNPAAVTPIEVQRWVDEGVIRYLGALEDVRPALKDCSVYVLPSYREGTPRTVLEAMSAGRAIITTDVPGCRETIIDGDGGWLVPARDPAAVAAAMARFIDDPGLAASMGVRARARAAEKYDVHKVNAVIMDALGL